MSMMFESAPHQHEAAAPTGGGWSHHDTQWADLLNLSSSGSGGGNHHDSSASLSNTSFSYQFQPQANLVYGDITDGIPTTSEHYYFPEVSNDLFGFIMGSTWHVLYKLPYLFYLIWPSETMFSSLDRVPRYVIEMFPVFFVASIFENAIRLLQGRSSIRINETVGSLSQGIFQECLRIKVRSIEVLMYCLIWDNFRLATLPWDSLWTWWLCYLAVDLGFYYAHRLAHEVNFIWAIHQAHHSSEEFSIVSALRQAVLQPFTAWFTYVPLALFIPPQVFLAHLQLSELYMAWLHTEIVNTIGPLEYILNTPSHHRVHHSRNPEYIDKNYGGMLIIWDRLLGTFKAEDKNNPPVYGLVHPVRSFNPIRVQFHPWPIIWRRIKRANTIKHKLCVLFYGPGWRPGVGRLGNIEDIPKLVHPVSTYDPPLSCWKKVYVILHFGLLLFFYHELTLYQQQFQALVLNIGVLSLLASITSLGLMLDDKRRYCAIYELSRCIIFFYNRHELDAVIAHGLSRTGLILAYRLVVISLVHQLFAISILLISIDLICRVLRDHHHKIVNAFEQPLNAMKESILHRRIIIYPSSLFNCTDKNE